MKIDIRADLREARRAHAYLKNHAINKAAARAINDALVTVRAEGSRAIKAEHPAMLIRDIKNNISTHRAFPQSLSSRLETKGRPLSLLLFKANETKRGVSARIGKGKRQIVMYHGRKAFRVAKYGNEVFVRRDAKGRRLRRFRGPSMPGVFRARSAEFRRIAQERWAKAFPNRMKYEIEQAKK